jgi:hypothetical protein
MPIKLRQYIKDKVEYVYRKFPGEHTGNQKYDLEPTQIYPAGKNIFSVLELATKEKLSGIELSPTTPVASIGTCFAEEFAFFMIKQGYNYIRKEDDALSASANWGRVYTIPNLQQIVHYSTDNSYPLVLEKTNKGWFDPLRESQYYSSSEIAEEAVLAHRKASNDALTSCDVLIITVGQNEAWVDNSNNMVWAQRPPKNIIDAREKDFSVHEFSYEKNISSLNDIVKKLQTVNKSLQILFTVSPVASYASFSDIDVVTQSFSNKCLLRTVVKHIVSSQPDRLFYFPSFEMVLCDNPSNFRADNRHVKYAMVNKIFSLLSNSTSLN